MNAISSLIAVVASAAALQVPPTHCLRDCRVSNIGLALIRSFEGFSPYIYDDAAGLPTIGFGHLIRPGETFKQPLLPDAADQLLRKDVGFAEKAINRRVQVRLAQHQGDALISFTFNLGEGALASSTLLKRVNAGRHAEVPEQFLRWVYAVAKRLEGLVRRREAEAELYKKGLPEVPQ